MLTVIVKATFTNNAEKNKKTCNKSQSNILFGYERNNSHNMRYGIYSMTAKVVDSMTS